MIVVDQVVDINNNDAIDYNVNLDLFANPSLAKLLSSGAAFTLQLKKAETRPMSLTCVAHPAGGFLLVRNNPYMAVTNEAGKLKIENIPVGKHTFVLWHERCGYVTQVKKGEEKIDYKLGRITVEIKPGDNDLGVMLCKPDRKK
jgi:hypothetical protein